MKTPAALAGIVGVAIHIDMEAANSVSGLELDHLDMQLAELTDDILESILVLLAPAEILSVSQCCRKLRTVCTAEPLWNKLATLRWGQQTPTHSWVRPAEASSSSVTPASFGHQASELVPATFRQVGKHAKTKGCDHQHAAAPGQPSQRERVLMHASWA